MKKSLTKAAAAVTLAGALAFGAPIAANAYTPDGQISGPPTLAPGEAATYGFADGIFEPGETVTFALTGENASAATLATIVKSAVETQSITKAANADGSTSVAVTLPPNANGNYTLNVFSASTTLPAIAITAVDTAVGAGAGGGTGADGSSDAALPNTGTDSALMLGLWVGGGALLLAGGAIVVGSTVRRQRQNAA